METAKVDIRKLQILNDRINQTLDALQQVRLSVHGIQHSAGIGWQQSPFGMGWNVQPQMHPYAQQQLNPFTQQQLNPFTQQQFASPFAQVPMGLGWGAQQQWSPFGIGHSSPEELQRFVDPRFTDPTLAYRMANAFPYAFAAVPPVVTLY